MGEAFEVRPEDMEFGLSRKEMFDYLAMIRKGNLTCWVCGVSHWGVAVTPVLASDDSTRELVYPDGVRPEFLTRLSAADRVFHCAPLAYSYLCVNCGHRVSFNAGVIAGAMARRRADANKG